MFLVHKHYSCQAKHVTVICATLIATCLFQSCLFLWFLFFRYYLFACFETLLKEREWNIYLSAVFFFFKSHSTAVLISSKHKRLGMKNLFKKYPHALSWSCKAADRNVQLGFLKTPLGIELVLLGIFLRRVKPQIYLRRKVGQL